MTQPPEQLLPCPFCGNDDIQTGMSDQSWPGVIVFCGSFDCAIIEAGTEREAIAAWNRRVT